MLFNLLKPLAEYGVSMTRIESRPSRRQNWDYVFFTVGRLCTCALLSARPKLPEARLYALRHGPNTSSATFSERNAT